MISALREHLIGADLTPGQRQAAIESLGGEALLPMVQKVVPAGEWVGHKPAHPGVWGGLL